ncbi:AI-2E family transporter [Actinobacteria bacterium IMCC25003]|nr:AI-2E family transporter [Actinobacteria bacterium IMCC25003]
MAISDRIKRKPKESPVIPDFGAAGAPIDRGHPFYFGFVATIGALSAFVLMRALASASGVFVLILVALFLATGLNPAVEAIRKRGLSRSGAVAVIFVAVILFVGLFAALVVPPLVTQGTHLIQTAPALLENLKNNTTIANLNDHYGLIDTLQKKLASVTSDGTLLITAFGGVIGVGKSVLSGTFTALTIIVLTLYFITSLPQATELGLKLVPASRRPRIAALTEAIIARVGAFVGSQILVSFFAAIFMTLLAFILGLPSPIAIGIIIFICGLVPLIGHFIGTAIYTIIALTQSVTIGVAAFIGYVVYVQVENYIITPKIMKRTLAVPGAVTIISALIGTSLLGLVGGLLAVPVAASIILILEEVVFPRAEKS